MNIYMLLIPYPEKYNNNHNVIFKSLVLTLKSHTHGLWLQPKPEPHDRPLVCNPYKI